MVERQRGFSPKEHKFVPRPLTELAAIVAEDFFGGEETGRLFRRRGIGRIAKWLRQSSPETQERFLVQFCVAVGFPNGERLGQFLGRVNSQLPLPEPSETQLQKWVNEHLAAINQFTMPIRIIQNKLDDTWLGREKTWTGTAGKKWNDALEEVYKIATEKERWLRIFHTASTIGQVAGSRPWAQYSARCAGWIVVEDLMIKKGYENGNPFLPLVLMGRSRYIPLGPTEIRANLIMKEHEEFVVRKY